MKRIVIITEILLAFLMGLIVGAQCRKNLLFLENNIKQIMNLSFSNIKFSERNEEKTAMKFYEDFLQGRNTAFSETMGKIGIEDIIIPKGEPEKHYYSKYALLDLDKDGLKELHVKSARYYYILKYKDNNLIIWTQLSPYSEPLNNGAFLEHRVFSAPSYKVYSYSMLDGNGSEIFELNFGTYDINYNGVQDHEDEYYFEGEKIEKDMWDRLTDKYLSVGSDKIEWVILFEETT